MDCSASINNLNRSFIFFERTRLFFSSLILNHGKQSFVKDVALPVIFEGGAIYAMAATTCYFIPSLLQRTFITSTIHFFAINALLRISKGCLLYVQNYRKTDDLLKRILDKALLSLELITAFRFGTFYEKTLNIVIHEGGHVLAALSVFKNPQPQIFIEGFAKGTTKIINTSLNNLGSKLGYENAAALFYIGGPLLAILSATGLLIAAYKMRKKMPKISLHLYSMSLQPIYQHSTQALKGAKDFAQLQKLIGLSPLMATLSCLAIPILSYCFVCIKTQLAP